MLLLRHFVNGGLVGMVVLIIQVGLVIGEAVGVSDVFLQFKLEFGVAQFDSEFIR